MKYNAYEIWDHDLCYREPQLKADAPNRHNSEAIRITEIEKDWCSGRKLEAVSEMKGEGQHVLRGHGPGWKTVAYIPLVLNDANQDFSHKVMAFPWSVMRVEAENKFMTVQHIFMSSASCDTWYVTINCLKLGNGFIFYLILILLGILDCSP